MADEITDADLVEAALGPAEVEGDQGRVKMRTIEELRTAQLATQGNAAASRVGFGLRIQRIKPGDCG
jgi:hypothetical protein